MTLRLYRPGTSVSTSSFVIEVPLASASGFADVSCVAVIKAQASKLGINGAHAAAAAVEGGGEAATAAVGATSSSSGAGAEAPPPPLQFKTKPRANALESIIEKLERRYASNVFFTNEVDEEEDDEDEEEDDDDEESKGDNGRGDRPSSTAPPADGADPDPTAAAAAAAAASTGAPAQDAAKKKKKKRPAVPEFYESDDGFVDDDEVRTYCGALQRQINPFPRTHDLTYRCHVARSWRWRSWTCAGKNSRPSTAGFSSRVGSWSWCGKRARSTKAVRTAAAMAAGTRRGSAGCR